MLSNNAILPKSSTPWSKHIQTTAVAKYKWTGHCECNSYLIVFIIVLIVYSLLMLEKEPFGAGEKAQWLRALTVLTEDPGSIPSTHMTAYKHL